MLLDIQVRSLCGWDVVSKSFDEGTWWIWLRASNPIADRLKAAGQEGGERVYESVEEIVRDLRARGVVGDGEDQGRV